MEMTNTIDLFRQLQNSVVLHLEPNEMACPQCEGLKFLYYEKDGRGFMETCTLCHSGKVYVCRYCGSFDKNNDCNCKEAENERARRTEKRRYLRAEKLTTEQYDGWVYKEGFGDNGGFFEDVETLKEFCRGNGLECPRWVYCCKSLRYKLDIDKAISDMLEDASEEAKSYLKDMKGLREFVTRWNAKQNVGSLHPDYKRIVVIEKEH